MTVSPNSQIAKSTSPSNNAAPASADPVDISVVIPIYNEEESIPPLYQALTAALEKIGRSYEIILVDDGSRDGSYAALCRVAEADKRVKVIQFRRNFGQTAAMAAGFDHAQGRVIIPMDGDLQNDPNDIPLLLEKIEEGYDVVSGWRKNRQDKTLLRKIPSRIANWLIGLVTGVKLHDYGCSLKAYRAEVLKGTRLYGEMHRFIPALANLMGAKITEVPVTHHARKFGKSKYGLKRTFKVLLDLLTVKFLSDYSTKPIYFFGGVGVTLCAGGVLAGLETLWAKYFQGVEVHKNPYILIAIFLFSLGVNFLLMGLLAEILVRTYHESQAKPIYWVRETKNFDKG
jgi:glycosyltransferase involved in cell wall biosynthesis